MCSGESEDALGRAPGTGRDLNGALLGDLDHALDVALHRNLHVVGGAFHTASPRSRGRRTPEVLPFWGEMNTVRSAFHEHRSPVPPAKKAATRSRKGFWKVLNTCC